MSLATPVADEIKSSSVCSFGSACAALPHKKLFVYLRPNFWIFPGKYPASSKNITGFQK